MKRDRLEKPLAFFDCFERKPDDPETTHYCPGCGHGIVHKLIAEALDELGVAERTILVNPVGCSVFAYNYFRVGNIQAPHGRAPAVATAVKRARPDSIVISYQGDGDLAAIGGNQILHTANRGENITVFFVNNAIYGMTGGQMAPTTLEGQRTSTTPQGRDIHKDGFPMRVCELLSALDAPAYLERVALDDTPHIAKARTAIKRALQAQVEGRGFSLVEILAMCPTGWHQEPVDSLNFIRDKMMPVFPLGQMRPIDPAQYKAPPPRGPVPTPAELAKVIGAELGAEKKPLKTASDTHENRIIVSGFGGQGVLYLGHVLAKTGLRAGREVSWIPSYGPEMRGGTAHCHVVIGDRRVGSPLCSKPTVLIALNQPSIDKFGPKVQPGGLVLYDSSLATGPYERADARCVGLPFSNIANELGDTDVANAVAMGALVELTQMVPPEAALELLGTSGTQRLRALNLRAFELGVNAAKALPKA